MVHQTWRTMDTDTWNNIIRSSTEEWLDMTTNDDEHPFAWFLWDDDGIDALMQKYEKSLYDDFLRLPYPVEKADVFRVIVLKWFGGIVSRILDCSIFQN
jgi:mannosyltransferase OCH1-like enzyme